MNINELIEPIEIKSRVFLKNIESASIQNEADKENACLLLKDICDYKKAIEQQKNFDASGYSSKENLRF